VDTIAPGFGGSQRDLYVGLFRTMLATQVAFAASLTLGQVLLAERRFFWYGVAPLLYNLGIIAGTIALAPSLGIYGPALGAVLGATIHLGSRVVGLRASAFRVRLGWRARRDALAEFGRLVLPKAVSQPVEPITFAFFTALASGLAAGGITAFNFARNFQSLPVSLVGVAFAVAVFPPLAEAHAIGDRREFVRLVLVNAARIAAVTLVAAAVMVVFGQLGIGILLGGGAFDAEDVALTASLLAAFAVSVPFESLSHLLSRAIYATRHTVLQVLASLAGLGVTVVVTLALVDRIGLLGIPLGFGIGQIAKTALLALALAERVRRWSGGRSDRIRDRAASSA
jgi:putative peptidoglycan lipid II flippase